MTHEGRGGGPYREPSDPLELMRKQIEVEGKFAIRLPENLEPMAIIHLQDIEPNLSKKTSTKNMAFFSEEWGVFRYVEHNDPKRGIHVWRNVAGDSLVAHYRLWKPPNGELYFYQKPPELKRHPLKVFPE